MAAIEVIKIIFSCKILPNPAFPPVIRTTFPFIELVFVTFKKVNFLPKQMKAMIRTKFWKMLEIKHPKMAEKKIVPWTANLIFNIVSTVLVEPLCYTNIYPKIVMIRHFELHRLLFLRAIGYKA